jgi:hypothetical protein
MQNLLLRHLLAFNSTVHIAAKPESGMPLIMVRLRGDIFAANLSPIVFDGLRSALDARAAKCESVRLCIDENA